MYCPECDLRVETEWSRFEDPEDAERLSVHYGAFDVEGPYRLDQVGSVTDPSTDGTVYRIGVRVDYCANCGAVVRVRTYSTPE